MNNKKINSLIYYFKTHPATVYSIKCIGSWEIETELTIENIEKCYRFITELKNKYEIIQETTVIPLFEDLKYQFSINNN